MVPEACSGKEPAGSKAGTGEAFTFNWGGPGGRARRARALSSLGAQPRAFVAPCSWHHGSREGSGAGDEKVAAVSLPGFPLTQTPEVGLGAGTFADVLVCAGSASPGARRRADDYIYGISRRPRWLTEEMKCALRDDMTMKDFQEKEYLLEVTPVDMRDNFRRKSFNSYYVRERSPHKRNTPFFRESPVGRKDSPHSRSGSSVSSRSYSPERSKTYSFHQSQHRKSVRAGACYKRQNEGRPERGKERPVQPLKTSRDTSPSSSSAVASSKVLDKPSRLTEKELAEAASKWAAEKLEKADESNLPEISEYEAGSTAPLFIDHPVEPESNATDGIELFEDSQLTSRSKAIATKTKEIEQVYRQDCETFGMVVKMLIEKDPSLEKSIQFALRQNLHEIGERCVEELKHFIAEYDTSSQDFGEPF
uniref:Periphilin 1 n=1 Tax=Bos indicus x Bos taurus TaxID=30522 RepID=A0A4W2IFH1_BOBOX